MEKKKCPHCRTEIDVKARSCPQCRKDVRTLKQRPLLLMFLGFMVFSLVMVVATMNNPSYTPWETYNTEETKIETPESYLNKNRWVAKQMCKDAILLQLKSPSSADFNNQEVTYTWVTWKEALVTWTVDAQNSFGASIRNSYSCYFKWMWETYNLESANLLN